MELVALEIPVILSNAVSRDGLVPPRSALWNLRLVSYARGKRNPPNAIGIGSSIVEESLRTYIQPDVILQ